MLESHLQEFDSCDPSKIYDQCNAQNIFICVTQKFNKSNISKQLIAEQRT